MSIIFPRNCMHVFCSKAKLEKISLSTYGHSIGAFRNINLLLTNVGSQRVVQRVQGIGYYLCLAYGDLI